jgi:hypothetical protein
MCVSNLNNSSLSASAPECKKPQRFSCTLTEIFRFRELAEVKLARPFSPVCPSEPFATVPSQRSDFVRAYTLEDILAPYRGYPKAIQQSILLAHTNPAFLVLTKSMRKVLCALLTRASVRNGRAPLKARTDRLAAEAGVSTKSVQRAIGAFCELGWMALPDTTRRAETGVFCSKTYSLTEALCRLIQLPTEEARGDDISPETKMSDGAVYVDLTFKEDQRKTSLEKSKGKPVQLPNELRAAASEFSIRETGIAALRGIAHQTGHRLESILAVARAYLRRTGAAGHRAFRYLQVMALRPKAEVDYDRRAAQLVRLACETQEKQAAKSLEVRCRYQQFVGPGGVRVRVFDGTAEVCINGQYQTVAGKDMAQIYERVRAGWLRPVLD